MKRFILSILALAGLLGIAHAVNITGTNSQNSNQVVSVGFVKLSTTDAITAFAGGGQASAVLLTSAYNRVTVVATANDSVKLPVCAAGAAGGGGLVNTVGLVVWVTNADSADSLDVYAQTDDTINAIAANSPFAMVAGKTSAFICAVAGKWYGVLGA